MFHSYRPFTANSIIQTNNSGLQSNQVFSISVDPIVQCFSQPIVYYSRQARSVFYSNQLLSTAVKSVVQYSSRSDRSVLDSDQAFGTPGYQSRTGWPDEPRPQRAVYPKKRCVGTVAVRRKSVSQASCGLHSSSPRSTFGRSKKKRCHPMDYLTLVQVESNKF